MAVVDDIAVALGRTTLSSADEDQWNLWISDAQMLIRAKLGDLDALDQDTLDYVIREAVVAQIRRPDDATQVEVRVDDGSTAKTYRTGSGRVTIQDWMWDLLSPTDNSSGAFSITPYGGTCSHLPWCSLVLGALYCSCGVDIAGYPIFETEDI